MTHRVQLIVNGKSYRVEVEDLSASPLIVRVNGQAYEVQIENADRDAAQSEKKQERKTAVSNPSIRPTANTITAPMPGNISAIAVAAGDTVTMGQELCTLDAMKMQNAIRSPRDGVIASIAVQPEQAVNHGDILFVFMTDDQ